MLGSLRDIIALPALRFRHQHGNFDGHEDSGDRRRGLSRIAFMRPADQDGYEALCLENSYGDREILRNPKAAPGM